MNASSRPPQIAVLCCFCAGVLPIVDGRVEAFRTSAGQFYCSEFCADDAAESAFRRRNANWRTPAPL
jgi:hypothetical protein